MMALCAAPSLPHGAGAQLTAVQVALEVEGIDVSSDSTQQLSLSIEAPRLNVETPGAALQCDCVLCYAAELCCDYAACCLSLSRRAGVARDSMFELDILALEVSLIPNTQQVSYPLRAAHTLH